MTNFDENTLMILKSYRNELQTLLDHLDDFFTEIIITGLTSLTCEEGFRKISKVQYECQQLGLNSTAYLLKSFLETLRNPTKDDKSRSAASLLLNRMLTWQIVFRKQFEYLTAGTRVLAEKTLAEMVETGVLAETYDLELIPFAVDLLKKTGLKIKLVVSCIDTSLTKFYQFKDELTTTDGYRSGPLKIKSKFFGGISWDYGAALNKVITVENVKMATTKTKSSTILSSSGIKYHVLQRTISTGHTELDRESFDPVLEALEPTGLVLKVEEKKLHFSLNDLSIDKKCLSSGSRSTLWRMMKVFKKYDTYLLISKSRSKTKQISSLYIPSMKRLFFPAIEKFQTTSPWSEELDDWLQFKEDSFIETACFLLLNPGYTKQFAAKLAEHCTAVISAEAGAESRTVLPLFLLHKGIVLLNHQSDTLAKEFRDKVVKIAVDNITRKPLESNTDLVRFVLAGLIMGELMTSKELSSLRNDNKMVKRSLIRGRKKKIKLDGDYHTLAKFIHEKLTGKEITKKKKRNLFIFANTLVEEITTTSKGRKVLDKLPKLAIAIHLIRHSLSEVIPANDQAELLESLYYIFKVEKLSELLSSSREEDRLNMLSLNEIIYILRKRKLPKLF
ncbi:MAG: hypothetical protein ACTSP4_06765 [Candidatus Hodarchaeales archaeon]